MTAAPGTNVSDPPDAGSLDEMQEPDSEAALRKSRSLDQAKARRNTSTDPEAPTTVAREADRRHLTDPKVMRALAHPLRLAIMEALLREGPLTATAAAEILDESPGNMSWHLNVLAKYGFVEEAPGGRGRSRPWRLVNLGTEFIDESEDSELSLAGDTFTRVLMERQMKRVEQWLDDRQSYPPEWKRAAFASNAIVYVTAEELDELASEAAELVQKFRDRTFDISKRPENSRPVAVSAFGHPLPPNASGN